MRMFNADGSEAEMCGNGVRCVAKYLYDHGLVRKTTLTIETGRGILTLDLEIPGGMRAAGARRHGRADPRSRAHSDHLARQSADWTSPLSVARSNLRGDVRVDGQPALRYVCGRDHRRSGARIGPQVRAPSGLSAGEPMSNSCVSTGRTT